MNVTVRQALLAAAYHLESHPKDWQYSTLRTPKPGVKGCAYGWFLHFLGKRWEDYDLEPGIPGWTMFSVRMDFIKKWYEDWKTDSFYGRWCAVRMLRRYAEEYHPETAQIIPFPARQGQGSRQVRRDGEAAA